MHVQGRICEAEADIGIYCLSFSFVHESRQDVTRTSRMTFSTRHERHFYHSPNNKANI